MADSENILTRTDDLIKWTLPKIEAMPRNYKFIFGDRLMQMLLDLLERLLEAYYSRDKVRPLTAANLQIEKLRHLLRICADMHWLGLSQYEFAIRELNAIGGMAGGWLRHARANAAE